MLYLLLRLQSGVQTRPFHSSGGAIEFYFKEALRALISMLSTNAMSGKSVNADRCMIPSKC